LQSISSQVEAFPGDQAVVQGFLDQKDALSSLVNQLKGDLPFTTLTQVNDAAEKVKTLQGSYDNFINTFGGKYEFDTSDVTYHLSEYK
jgi:hypothetical protein